MSVCAIVGAGDFFPDRFERDKYDFIIAADGGCEALSSIGITPDLVIGDFDSGSIPESVKYIRYKVEKDETDMHLAFLEGVRRGYDTFYVFGGVGGSEDHTFNNYCLLYYAKKQGKTMYLMGDNAYWFVIANESVTLSGKTGCRLSLFAFGGATSGVTVKGTKYEADDVTLTPEFPLGVSNSFIGKPAEISVKRGALLIMAENK